MPKWKIHFALSKKRTENPYKELHMWIDENKDESGVNHRNKKHYYTEELRDYVYNKFGGSEAVSEWLFHIALDNLDTSVTNDWMHKVSDSNFHKFGFENDGWIHYEENELDEDGMEEEFEMEDEEDE